jgi:tRNA-dihydrouridine synthase A
MLGRSAYHDPMLVGRLDAGLWGVDAAPAAGQIVERYAAYMRLESERGTPLRAMSRHLVGLFAHRPGARQWRRSVTLLDDAGQGIDRLLDDVTSMTTGTRYNAEVHDHATSNTQTR